MNLKQTLSSKALFIIWIVSWFLGYGIFGGQTVIGSAFNLLGLLALIFAIIAFFRERKKEEKSQRI
jgi:hypothetical protein